MTGSNFVDLAQRYGNSVPVTRLTREAGHMLDIDTFTEQWVSPRPASEAKLAVASDVAGRSASRAWSRRPRPIAGEATATTRQLGPQSPTFASHTKSREASWRERDVDWIGETVEDTIVVQKLSGRLA